jgi:hypothetical protein
MKTTEIIKYLNQTPLDINHAERLAKMERVSIRKFLTEYIENNFNSSRYTANKVVDYLLN